MRPLPHGCTNRTVGDGAVVVKDVREAHGQDLLAPRKSPARAAAVLATCGRTRA